ncbi:MAG: enoyl-CoA hydratase/isomerase family protein [Cyclobacteriaceae bacterium]|jgi:methylglutaconyl-CoA hydratase|nr:enoyl-CoA hydratase/isomerase family protein [Flammeovirgaceae bacterium]MCZ8021760.1 enoyl-CoA hydratase/isomerase family protein [Cytophagales bacterium]MCZ8328357.1 enoyl-CoA hydratase/isomerase family protein [Cyclobacteriaceae bacterium]
MTNMIVTYETKDRVGYITLNRPEKRNALSYEMVSELKKAFKQAEEDAQAKVIVLQSNGESFCAGADLAYLQQLQANTLQQNHEDSTHLKELFFQIYTLPKVIIASVQGHALAGGCGLASVCDFAIAVPGAKFGYTEVKIGFIPAIVMYFLVKKIGEGKARQLLLSGDLITAEQAAQMGLINQVVEAEKLQEQVSTLAQQLITQNSAQAMATTKKMLAAISGLDVNSALAYAAAMNAEARATADCKKGIAAFLAKEKISW